MVKKAGVGVLHTGILQHVSIRVFHCALNTEVGTQHNSGVSLDFFADPQKSKRTLSFYFANPRLLHIITPHRTGSNILLIDTYTNWLFFSFYWGLLRHSVQLLAGAENSSADAGTGILPRHSKVPYLKKLKEEVSQCIKRFPNDSGAVLFFGQSWVRTEMAFYQLTCWFVYMQHLYAWHPFVLIHLFLRHGLEHDISTMIRDV